MPTFRQQIITILCAPLPARCGRWLAVAVLLVLGAAHASADDSEELTATKLEYQVKAGFLFNFAKFVEWPANAQTNSPKFRIGIVDDEKSFPVITEVLAGKTLGAREIEIVRVKSGHDLKLFNMVFVTRSQAKRTEAVLKAVGTAPVLTVGEMGGFAAGGGCINFVPIGKNIRFEVNLAATERAGLKISSKLAAVAIIVREEEAKK